MLSNPANESFFTNAVHIFNSEIKSAILNVILLGHCLLPERDI